MKSIVNINPLAKETKFPKLMINSCTIVLMLGDGRGQVVNSTDPRYPVGIIGKEWANFVDFEGSVTLSND